MAKYDERISNLKATVIDRWAGDGIASQCATVFEDEQGRKLTWRTDHFTWENLWLLAGEQVVITSGFRYGSDIKRVKVERTTK